VKAAPTGHMAIHLHKENYLIGERSFTLLVPDALQVKHSYQQGERRFPYWSQVWPSARALSAFLLAHPVYVQGMTVLELAAGLGLPSLVASEFARSVICSDLEPEAVETVQQLARLHRRTNLEARVIDWDHFPPNLSADVLLLSDVNYEPAAFEKLRTIIQTFLRNGSTVVLTTPQRLVAKSFLEPLLEYCVHTGESSIEHAGTSVRITVAVLRYNGKQ